ncbi:MAG: signal peptidase I [Acidimicrobiia bacterium]
MARVDLPSTVAEGESGSGPVTPERRPMSRWGAVIPEPDTSGAVEAPPGPPPRKSMLRELPVLLVIAFLIAFAVKSLVAQAFFIPSPSMENTLKEGDRVLVSRLSFRLHEPRRGDVVVFESPLEGEEDPDDDEALPVRVLHGILESIGLRQPSTDDYIKRVIALPGETVEGKDGKVFVDGRVLAEPYLKEAWDDSFPKTTVPEDELWVMGDNRNHSSDSRAFGTIDEDTVVGRAILRIWPVPRLGFL